VYGALTTEFLGTLGFSAASLELNLSDGVSRFWAESDGSAYSSPFPIDPQTKYFGNSGILGTEMVEGDITTITPGITVLAVPGETYAIDLSASVVTLIGTGVAEVDPVLRINPSFPNADQYTLSFSPGILNEFPSAPVPEPTTILLVGISVVTFGLVRLRPRERRLFKRYLYKIGIDRRRGSY
jgi:hypothetical protein